MKILKQPITNIVILVLLLSGCRKHETEPAGPKPYLGGRVVLINSDTPVPDALVRFMKWQSGGSIFDPMVYVEVASDTTDANGHFEIPSGTGATMAIAYGVDSIFDHESQEGSVEAYWDNGGELKLQLIPPAWVKVIAMDIEPIVENLLYVQGFTEIGSSTGQTNLDSFQIWQVDGNISQDLYYRFAFIDGTFGQMQMLSIDPPIAFDTTIYVINY